MQVREGCRGAAWLGCLAALLLALPGTGCEEPEGQAAVAAENALPAVGILELPFSHRSGAPAPTNAVRVEIGIKELRVDGETLLPLVAGRLEDGAGPLEPIAKLSPKLSSGARGGLALLVSVMTPYGTLARVLHTARQAGLTNFYFQVRKPGTSKDTGWMALPNLRTVTTVSAEQPPFADADLLPWSAFTDAWDASHGACRASGKADCGYRPPVKAEGGQLMMSLRARGRGMALRFSQYGVPDEGGDQKQGAIPALLAGIVAEGDEEPPPTPEKEALFTVRAQDAMGPDSSISQIVRPVCTGRTCAALVHSDRGTQSRG